MLFGLAACGFIVCFGTHAFLVDTGRLNASYLSTFRFLALVGLMSYELAGEVLKKTQLSSELVQKELELRAAVADERLPKEVHVTLYCVAQQALHNVLKHAQATELKLALHCQDQHVMLSIEDHGRGFENQESTTAGLRLGIMQERVRAVGGQLQIESIPEAGTTVNVRWSAPNGGSAKNGY